jgi:hypothetical protein
MEESLHFPQHLQNWSEVEVGVWEVPADSKALLRDADLCIPCTESGSDAGERGTRVSTPPILTCKPRAAQFGGWMDGWMDEESDESQWWRRAEFSLVWPLVQALRSPTAVHKRLTDRKGCVRSER